MQVNLKLAVVNPTALAIILALSCFGSIAQDNQYSWSTMDDIRQVSRLASGSKWETLKENKGVKLSSRWLTFGDTLKTREIASHFVVNANIQNVLECLMDPEKVLAWNDGVKSLNVYKQDGSTWVTHTVYDIPYPLSQQDLVVNNVMIQEKQKIIILMSSRPDYIEPLKNVNRQQLYFGKWELIALDNLRTEVRFSAISFSKSNIPRFIRDPIVQNKLFNSFVRLKELSLESANAVANQVSSASSTPFSPSGGNFDSNH